MLPKSIPKTKYQLQFTEGTGEKKHDWINVKCTLHDVLCFISCAIVGTFYIYSKVLFYFWLFPSINITNYINIFLILALDYKQYIWIGLCYKWNRIVAPQHY